MGDQAGAKRKSRNLAALVALCFLSAGAAIGAAQQAANEGAAASKTAPEANVQKPLEVVDADRYAAILAEFHGKPLMVTFWATWCEPCRDEYPVVIELARQYGPKGLAVFGIDLDDDAEEPLALRFVARTQPVFPNYRKKPGKEDEFINRVNAKWSGVLPATFFYTPDGKLVAQLVGEQKREAFVSAIEQLLADQAKK